MLSDVYSDRLLAAAASLPPARRLPSPDASSTKVSRVCGSEVTIDLMVDGDVVVDFALEAKACALGQASAGLAAEKLIGADRAGLVQLRDEMYAMLHDGGDGPSDPRWVALDALKVVRDYPQRHASTLLIFDAICACFDERSSHRKNATAD